jgi:threonylcarbamoyladenosine tRNA methylthiotransferase MtaB
MRGNPCAAAAGGAAAEKPETLRVAVATLGCKVNQCESAGLTEALAAGGMTPVTFAGQADIYIVNTCTVTGRTDYQSRQLIRRAIRQNPAATVLVTGCYAQRAPEEIARIPGVRIVAGNAEKEAIPVILSTLGTAQPRLMVGNIAEQTAISPLGATRFPGHTRAFLKIQDGCNGACSYCIVPSTRGPSRSLPPEAVRERIAMITRAGYREVVLTGIHLGAYGRDLRPAATLAALLRDIAAPPVERLRLSSIEPREITDELIALIAAGGVLCRHLHIPLQSGDDGILAAMNRDYDGAFFRDLVARIVRDIPGLAVGIDVLTGFPGETEAAFANTLRLLEEMPIAYLHVFPFSRRPGTPAAGMTGQVPEAVKKARAAQLRSLGAQKRQAFADAFIGRPLAVLIETRRDKATGFCLGLSDNYLSVAVRGGGVANRIVPVRPHSFADGRLLAEVTHE